jgi:hypothetical protein
MDSKTKVKKASDKALLDSVKEEMAQPRISGSAKIETEKQSHAKSRHVTW